MDRLYKNYDRVFKNRIINMDNWLTFLGNGEISGRSQEENR